MNQERQDLERQRQAVARRLRMAREMAGLSQGQVAKLLDWHRPSVTESEAGRRRVSAEELARFATIYGVSPDWLVGIENISTNLMDDRIQLAARELSKIKPADLERVLHLLAALRRPPQGSKE